MLISCKCLNILLETDSNDDRNQLNQLLLRSKEQRPKQPSEHQPLQCSGNTAKLTLDVLHFFKIVSIREHSQIYIVIIWYILHCERHTIRFGYCLLFFFHSFAPTHYFELPENEAANSSRSASFNFGNKMH